MIRSIIESSTGDIRDWRKRASHWLKSGELMTQNYSSSLSEMWELQRSWATAPSLVSLCASHDIIRSYIIVEAKSVGVAVARYDGVSDEGGDPSPNWSSRSMASAISGALGLVDSTQQ
jgi:hypothetical protein